MGYADGAASFKQLNAGSRIQMHTPAPMSVPAPPPLPLSISERVPSLANYLYHYCTLNNTNQMDKNKGNLSKKEQRKLLFKKSKEKKGKPAENDQIASMSAERLKAYALNPKKFKNKLKYMKKK